MRIAPDNIGPRDIPNLAEEPAHRSAASRPVISGGAARRRIDGRGRRSGPDREYGADGTPRATLAAKRVHTRYRDGGVHSDWPRRIHLSLYPYHDPARFLE